MKLRISEFLRNLNKRNSCSRKVRYGREQTANKAVKAMESKYDDHLLESYKCKFCDGWHIGHRIT